MYSDSPNRLVLRKNNVAEAIITMIEPMAPAWISADGIAVNEYTIGIRLNAYVPAKNLCQKTFQPLVSGTKVQAN